MRENTTEILELSNYQVLAADKGSTGVELAVKKSPDLIICDIGMPDMDGKEVLEELNNINSTKNIPFFFLTAFSEKSQISDGLAKGADEYIVKPYKGDELLKMVGKYLVDKH